MECAAVFDAAATLGVLDQAVVTEAKQLLERIVRMLTKLGTRPTSC